MELTTCRDCEKQFSTDSKRCPHCGAYRPGYLHLGSNMGCGIVILLIVLYCIVMAAGR